MSIYGSSKAAVIGFTKSWGKELAPYGVRVNCVVPGVDRSVRYAREMPDWFSADSAHRIPMARLARAHEVANMVAFLLSDEASFVTGACYDVSGGRAPIEMGWLHGRCADSLAFPAVRAAACTTCRSRRPGHGGRDPVSAAPWRGDWPAMARRWPSSTATSSWPRRALRRSPRVAGGRTIAVEADVSNERDVERAVAHVITELGRVDVLINNAGHNIRKPLLDYTLRGVRTRCTPCTCAAPSCSARGRPPHARAAIRHDHQYRLDPRPRRGGERGALRGGQGGLRAAHQGAGARAGAPRHPRQRHRAGLHRHAAHPAARASRCVNASSTRLRLAASAKPAS